MKILSWVGIMLTLVLAGFAATASQPQDALAVTDITCPQSGTCTGTNGDDDIHGTDGNNIIDAKAGIDQVWGKGGDDQIVGGDNGDGIEGGNGSDFIQGGNGPDTLQGQGGQNNDVRGGDGNNDDVRAQNGYTSDHLSGGPGSGDRCAGDWDVSSGQHDQLDSSCEFKIWQYI